MTFRFPLRTLFWAALIAGASGVYAQSPDTAPKADASQAPVPASVRSTTRSGLDQLWISLSWAPMNQARDDTKPTWILTAEFRPSIGKLMKFNSMSPTSEAGVSTGVNRPLRPSDDKRHGDCTRCLGLPVAADA
jgi:hypothetical protein